MNYFDLSIIIAVLLLTLLGLRAGFLRSAADILGYLAAAPIAVALTPTVSAFFSTTAPAAAVPSPEGKFSIVFFGLLLAGGIIFAQLFRACVNIAAGDEIGILDRAAGGLLGAARALLVFVTMVLVFDRIIPPGRTVPFLESSRFYPLLSRGAALGLKSLPPDITDYIDRMKRQQGL